MTLQTGNAVVEELHIQISGMRTKEIILEGMMDHLENDANSYVRLFVAMTLAVDFMGFTPYVKPVHLGIVEVYPDYQGGTGASEKLDVQEAADWLHEQVSQAIEKDPERASRNIMRLPSIEDMLKNIDTG